MHEGSGIKYGVIQNFGDSDNKSGTDFGDGYVSERQKAVTITTIKK